MRKRQVNQTAMNVNSSRSHAILNIFLEQVWVEKTAPLNAYPVEDGRPETLKQKHYRKALLTIVDLAGSERLNKTGSEHQRLKEAQNINKSISALGNCIASLA